MTDADWVAALARLEAAFLSLDEGTIVVTVGDHSVGITGRTRRPSEAMVLANEIMQRYCGPRPAPLNAFDKTFLAVLSGGMVVASAPLVGITSGKQAVDLVVSLAKKLGVDSPDDVVSLVRALTKGKQTMNWLKKYGPLGATILALLGGVLTLFGAGAPAAVIESVAKMLGGADPAILGGTAIGVLLLSCATIVKRSYSLYLKAVGPVVDPTAPTGGVSKILWRWGGLIGTLGTIAVVLLGAFGQADTAAQVNGLLTTLGALFGQIVPDHEIASAFGVVVLSIVSVVKYINDRLKSKAPVATLDKV